MLLLIRHARTRQEKDRPVDEWALDPAGLDQMRILAGTRDWTAIRHWYSSPEQKAIATARFLTTRTITPIEDLRELRRGGWNDNYDDVVARLFADQEASPAAGWESGREAVTRFDAALRTLVERHPGEDIAA